MTFTFQRLRAHVEPELVVESGSVVEQTLQSIAVKIDQHPDAESILHQIENGADES